jgi:hypothetical protein
MGETLNRSIVRRATWHRFPSMGLPTSDSSVHSFWQPRKSDENPAVAKLHHEFLGQPLDEESHHLLHAEYSPREMV